jgi:hypothetical protein
MILLRIEWNHLEVSNLRGKCVLTWPEGDRSTIRQWRLAFEVTGLSVPWSFQLDLRWTPQTTMVLYSQPGNLVIVRSADENDSQASALPLKDLELAVVATNPELWRKRRDGFRLYEERFSSLSAHWRAALKRWSLWWGDSPDGSKLPSSCNEILDACCREAVTPFAQTTLDLPPWTAWLEVVGKRSSAGQAPGRGSQNAWYK